MLDAFKKLGLKIHFLKSHLDYFPENFESLSEEQGESFHQDVKEIERRYQATGNTKFSPITVGCLSKRFQKLHIEEKEKE